MLGLPPARLPNRLAPVVLPAGDPLAFELEREGADGRGARSAVASALGAGGCVVVVVVVVWFAGDDGEEPVFP